MAGQGFDSPIVHHRQESRYFSDFPAFLLCGNILWQLLIQSCEKLPKIKIELDFQTVSFENIYPLDQ